MQGLVSAWLISFGRAYVIAVEEIVGEASAQPPGGATAVASEVRASGAPRGRAPQARTCSLSCLSWLHLLKSWSLRQTQGGSISNMSVAQLQVAMNYGFGRRPMLAGAY